MGTTLTDEELRKELRDCENEYKEAIRKEMFDKFRHVCKTILPALMKAVFDPTVRSISLDIVRPDSTMIDNNCKMRKSGNLNVSAKNMLNKAAYLEELYNW